MLPPIPLPCLTGFLLLASKKPQKSAVARSPPQLIVNQQKTETYYLIMRHSTSKIPCGTSSHTTPHKLSPTPRANPFPKVTDPFCRLPLPTLFHRPEAVNLGDLLRLLVRSGEKSVYIYCFPSIFKDRQKRTGHLKIKKCSADRLAPSPANPIPGPSNLSDLRHLC